VTFQKVTTEPIAPSRKTKPSHKTQTVTKKKHLTGKSNTKIVKKPTTPPADTDSTVKKLTIQIASLRDPKVADQLVASLRKNGFPAYKTMGIISENNIWYRVRAGYFQNKAESRTMMAKLKKKHKGAFLLKR
jgi:cell division septation protein DedD